MSSPGGAAAQRLAEVLDAHDWAQLPGLLHPEFRCRYVHTGEEFDRDGWVRLNADYPGFERYVLQELVANGDRSAVRARVTARTAGARQHFEVAGFLTVRDGLVLDLTEVWTDVEQQPPSDARPQPRQA